MQIHRVIEHSARVLFARVEIGGVPEVAPVLGISDQTVKSHLHRIYEKTVPNGKPTS